MQLTPNFNLEEWRCRDGTGVPAQYVERVRHLARQLEVLRAELGNRPIKILSGYRTPAWNRKIKGAVRSQHRQARAADIRVKGVSPERVAQTIEDLILAGRMDEGGLHCYPAKLWRKGFVHYDTRGRKARW